MFFFTGANDSGNHLPAVDHARSTLDEQFESDIESDDKEDDDDGMGEGIPKSTDSLFYQLQQPNPRLRIDSMQSESEIESESNEEDGDDGDDDNGDGEEEEYGDDDQIASENGRFNELEEELKKLTVKVLQLRLRELELPVSGRKAELIERLLGRGKTTGKVKEWKKSKAKLLLLSMFADKNSRVHNMTTEEVYNSHPWFQNYPLSKFGSYLKTIQSAAKNLEDVVREDEREIQSELIAFPRGEMTIRGYPFWDTHTARSLLETDIRDGEAMKPKELWLSRDGYKEFPLSVFRDHIHQEKRRQREEPGWVVKRNKKAREIHEEEIEEKKKGWDMHVHEEEINEVCEQWEGMGPLE